MKKAIFLLLVLLLIIQFIRPAKNISASLSANDITRQYAVPDPVLTVLKRSCYDCHSNNTAYPWYDNIQPVAWWLDNHVTGGKHALNFSEFASYPPKQQVKKLKNFTQEIKDDGMPLNSYLWIHRYARLSPEEKSTLINWADSLRAQIKI